VTPRRDLRSGAGWPRRGVSPQLLAEGVGGGPFGGGQRSRAATVRALINLFRLMRGPNNRECPFIYGSAL